MMSGNKKQIITDMVSVVVPAYNGSKYIEEAVLSIIYQTYNKIEILVIADGSTDDTRSIINRIASEDNRVKYYYQNNRGVSAARNYGISNSAGEFITFFDSDDVMVQDKIQKQIIFMMEQKDVDIVFCDYINFRNGDEWQSHFRTCKQLSRQFDINNTAEVILTPNQAINILIEENFTIASSPLFRRHILEKYNGYNDLIAGSEDWYLHFIISNENVIGVMNYVGFKRRLHLENASSNKIKMAYSRALSREMSSHRVCDTEIKHKLLNTSSGYYYELSMLYKSIDKKKSFKYLIKALMLCKIPCAFYLKPLVKIVREGK